MGTTTIIRRDQHDKNPKSNKKQKTTMSLSMAIGCQEFTVGGACIAVYDPICVNGAQKYSSLCGACTSGDFFSRAAKYVKGECPASRSLTKECESHMDGKNQTCSRDYEPICVDGTVQYATLCVGCSINSFDANATYTEGECVTKSEPCLCSDVDDPVCGTDGIEYSNSCRAGCEGVKYKKGKCDSKKKNSNIGRVSGENSFDLFPWNKSRCPPSLISRWCSEV